MLFQDPCFMTSTLLLKRSANLLRTALLFALLPAAINVNAQNSAQADSLKGTTEVKDNSKEPDASGVYKYVDEMPLPNIDISSFLAKNIRYSEKAKRKKIEGRVVLRFVIDKDGSIKDIKVKSTPHEMLSDEAIRVVNMMPKWKPGKQNGVAVPVYFTLPIVFKLDN